MHTTVDKHKPKPFEHIVNYDGKAWTVIMPKGNVKDKKYKAIIPDKRLDHCSFECFGYHYAWADTIDELMEDIISFEVPYYSTKEFTDQIRQKDLLNNSQDRQVELHWDGRGTTITRGNLTPNNMTEYTSF